MILLRRFIELVHGFNTMVFTNYVHLFNYSNYFKCSFKIVEIYISAQKSKFVRLRILIILQWSVPVLSFSDYFLRGIFGSRHHDIL